MVGRNSGLSQTSAFPAHDSPGGLDFNAKRQSRSQMKLPRMTQRGLRPQPKRAEVRDQLIADRGFRIADFGFSGIAAREQSAIRNPKSAIFWPLSIAAFGRGGGIRSNECGGGGVSYSA